MLDLLETLCAIADTGSLSKAAQQLHLTQPAVTRKVHALEQELGAVLLSRTSHGAELTPAGQAVLKHARRALSAVNACRNAALTAAGNAEGRLRIAAGVTVTMYYLPGVLARFRERWPEVQIDLRPGHNPEAVERVLNYEADVGVIGSDVGTPELREIPLTAHPMVLVCPPGSPNRPATLADLTGENLLLLPVPSATRREIEQVMEEKGVTYSVIEFPSPETIKQAVSFGMGFAIMPEPAVAEEVRLGRLVARPLTDWPLPPRLIRAFVRREGEPPEPVRQFIQLLREGEST